LTGDGVRQTLAVLGERIPLAVHEVASGTQVLDWTVPDEWNVRSAYILDPAGRRIADFERHSLHLVGYSEPVDATVSLAELKGHLHSLPEQPGRIPYRTSYYRRTWGFCLTDHELRALPDGAYRAVVDASLGPGHLSYGECLLPGAEPEEVLISCHVCHPSLANDNLSGIAVATCLAKTLAGCDLRWSYRFLFIPGTIGSITWLARNEEAAGRVRAGLVAANLGDPGGFHYKRSRRGDAWIDRAVETALRDLGEELTVEPFTPYGYDERQYCSPGFDLPVGSLTRTPWGRYPEYHTSADDLDFIRPDPLAGALGAYLAVAEVLEGDRRFENLSPKGEPQLGRRGLYGSIGGAVDGKEQELALLWLLNLADGRHTLLDVARRSGMPFAAVAAAARALEGAGLLRELALEGAASLTR
jgi:aminopeptidase-like protein